MLLDWSCRESFHIFEYLSAQSVDRNKFEILWIEYYHRRANEIAAAIRKSQLTGTDPPVDKWIVLDMPSNLYYHKYLMYNVGIVASAGKIVTFCDSDGIVSENFVNSIIASFNQDPNIVLHMDQVRNGAKKYYPFNYPSLEEITTQGKNNVVDSKPAGLMGRGGSDPHPQLRCLHERAAGRPDRHWRRRRARGLSRIRLRTLRHDLEAGERRQERGLASERVDLPRMASGTTRRPELFRSPRWTTFVVHCAGSTAIREDSAVNRKSRYKCAAACRKKTKRSATVSWNGQFRVEASPAGGFLRPGWRRSRSAKWPCENFFRVR